MHGEWPETFFLLFGERCAMMFGNEYNILYWKQYNEGKIDRWMM